MLNIVVPMAGAGSRFKNAGYVLPKPLIEINGKPMIQVVIENLKVDVPHKFVFIVRREHYDKFGLEGLLHQIAPSCEIVITDGLTAGAACTVLLAKEFIDNNEELIVANSDQYVEDGIKKFIQVSRSNSGLDGLIMTFKATHPKWSFAKVGDSGFVIEVAEKKPISDDATVGIYYYRKGKDFVYATMEMIRKDIRVNNEFYVCPAYNEMIALNKKIKILPIDVKTMHGLGTPEDLENFKQSDAYTKI